MNPQLFVDEFRLVLSEALEGGIPGQPTTFLDGTKADGSDNHGLFATLEGLSAAQASDPTALGLSIAAHTAHLAFHLEVVVRWEAGDHGPFDWKGSFSPSSVVEPEWDALRARVRKAYADVLEQIEKTDDWSGDAPGLLFGPLAHATYHLGAIRQTVKLLK